MLSRKQLNDNKSVLIPLIKVDIFKGFIKELLNGLLLEIKYDHSMTFKVIRNGHWIVGKCRTIQMSKWVLSFSFYPVCRLIWTI